MPPLTELAALTVALDRMIPPPPPPPGPCEGPLTVSLLPPLPPLAWAVMLLVVPLLLYIRMEPPAPPPPAPSFCTVLLASPPLARRVPVPMIALPAVIMTIPPPAAPLLAKPPLG